MCGDFLPLGPSLLSQLMRPSLLDPSPLNHGVGSGSLGHRLSARPSSGLLFAIGAGLWIGSGRGDSNTRQDVSCVIKRKKMCSIF
jgi:hypothetical protein